MWRQLGQVFTELADDRDLRCIVLRGAGERAFAAGADIAAFETERNSPTAAKSYAETTSAALSAIAQCPQPIVAPIKGACVGGGLEIASFCDAHARDPGRARLHRGGNRPAGGGRRDRCNAGGKA
jgi:enoyl-CoA hydratase/carnithine racemase